MLDPSVLSLLNLMALNEISIFPSANTIFYKNFFLRGEFLFYCFSVTTALCIYEVLHMYKKMLKFVMKVYIIF